MSDDRSSNFSSGFQLQTRDRLLLTELYGHGVLSRDQIINFDFFSSIQRANSRLRKLMRQGLIARYRDPLLGPMGLYLPTLKSVPVIAESLDAEATLIREVVRHGISPLTLRHSLRVTDVRIRFSRLASEKCQAFKFLPERRIRHEYSVRARRGVEHRVFKPDALLQLSGQSCAIFFIEADLGNVSAEKIRQKLESYRLYEREAFQDVYRSESFTVLFLTTGQERLANLGRTCKESCTSATILLATFDEFFDSRTLTDPIWVDGKSGTKTTLLSGVRP